jgi:hypothetical protein
MVRPLPILVSVVVLVAAGVVHGIRTDRWVYSPELQQAVDRLENFPMKVGDWEAEKAEDVAPDQARVAQIAGYRSLKFTNRFSGEQVSLLLLCGRPAAMAKHTPEMCYQGAGYSLTSAPQQHIFHGKGRNQEFWTAPFVKPGPIPMTIRIFWAWSDKGDWVAAKNPRLSFLGHPALYKLYVISAVSAKDQKAEETAAAHLLRALLPEIQRSLSPVE